MKTKALLAPILALCLATHAHAEKPGPSATDKRTFYDVATLGSLEEVKAWIKKDPSVVNSRDKYGFTALHGVVGEDSPEIARLLIKSGADVNSKNEDGIQPLHVAGNPEMVEILLDAGADLNGTDKDGSTPLIVQSAEPDSEEVMETLLLKGADPSRRDRFGKSALDIARSRKEKDKVELLEEYLKGRKGG